MKLSCHVFPNISQETHLSFHRFSLVSSLCKSFADHVFSVVFPDGMRIQNLISQTTLKCSMELCNFHPGHMDVMLDGRQLESPMGLVQGLVFQGPWC